MKELPADEHSVLWLSDRVDKGKRDALAYELYYRVRDLAIREAAREAFYAGTPSETKEPVSVTSDEIVIPLADFLVTPDDETLSELVSDLFAKSVYNTFQRGQSEEEVEEAVRLLLKNNPDLIRPEDVKDALTFPQHERGEILFDRLRWNL